MGSSRIAGSPMTRREGSAAMALMTAATEANTHIVSFTASVDGQQLRPGYRPTRLMPLPPDGP